RVYLPPFNSLPSVLAHLSLSFVSVTSSRWLSRMNILDLPDVFLRELLRTVGLKERARLRRTCRTFEKLVAETHAGHFKQGQIYRDSETGVVSLFLAHAKFTIAPTDEGKEKFIRTRCRLFSAISIESFYFELDEDLIKLDFVRNFITNFEIGILQCAARTDEQLEMSIQLMSDYPRSQWRMELSYLPDAERLLSIPPMANMKIFGSQENTQIPAELF
ncbi:hypothetical protein PENTCL1PPCAC_21981, partial [Pristionchus entomophagus]